MQDDDGAMPLVEPSEGIVEQLTVGEVAGDVAHFRHVERRQLDLHRTSSTTPSEIEAGVDNEAMEPGVEPAWIAQPWKVAPDSDERLLDRIARELRVPENESGRRVQPRDGQVDERGEGVMIARSGTFDETSLVHGRLGYVTATMVVFDRVWRAGTREGS